MSFDYFFRKRIALEKSTTRKRRKCNTNSNLGRHEEELSWIVSLSSSRV